MTFHDFPGPLLFSMTFQDQWSPWYNYLQDNASHAKIKITPSTYENENLELENCSRTNYSTASRLTVKI